jgi:uncharacterized protein (DUF1778 family)
MAAKKQTVRRKAGRKDNKNKGIFIRVTETQKKLLTGTAKDAGLGLSSWMLSVALRAAQAAQKKTA